MPTVTFDYTGNRQKFNIPTGVKIIDVVVQGAESNGRGGGRVAGRMTVNAKEDLFIYVGQRGQAPSGGTGGVPAYGGGGRGGAGAGPARPGGWGGGGASVIRYGAADGPIRVAAGGAGGQSGDGGLGGRGGNSVPAGEGNRGELGFNSAATGSAQTGRATGGTQNQGGRGGTVALGKDLQGLDGGGRTGLGGRGGSYAPRIHAPNIYGGGGGGGGFFPGGGGQAGIHNFGKGGGGGGGSNFDGGLYNATSTRGNSSVPTGHGRVTITWDTPGGDNPPTAPNEIKINGVNAADGLATRAPHSVVVSGKPNDPDAKPNVRLKVRVADNPSFSGDTWRNGTYDDTDERDKVTLVGLKSNTRYYLRIHTQAQPNGKVSVNYTSTNFWTNRSPNPPALTSPVENSSIPDVTNLTFNWNHSDPDGGADNTQNAYQFRYRRAARPGLAATNWVEVGQVTTAQTRNFPAFASGGPFTPNYDWEWTVRTQDQQGAWGQWAQPKSFFVSGTTLAPIPRTPRFNEAVRVERLATFIWLFRKVIASSTQVRADVRYRVVGSSTWTQVDNAATSTASWVAPINTFTTGLRYEWQVRTYAIPGVPSAWSESETFYGSSEPGTLTTPLFVDSGRPASGLGEGVNRAFIYDRGGKVQRGEIKNPRLVRWGRTRDDISACTLYVDEYDADTLKLFKNAGSWRNEIVVFRTDSDGRTERVWEGPITRKSSSRSSIEIEAKDVMAYPYRRIMRQGYSDQYQIINGQQTGLTTIIQRATQILLNALVYDDPNLIPYITALPNAGDAKSSRSRPDFSRMAWDEIDDMAAVAGLDYTALGRRIILNDTHRAIGKLPEMTEKDFDNPPVISEYGMSAAYLFAVTNGSGIYGTAQATVGSTESLVPLGPEGWIEQLASAYGEDQTAMQAGALSSAAAQKLRDSLSEQARRNISGRWPVPKLVRVPDNSRFSPSLQVGINDLVPGVWIPLRADNGVESITQWQKLDSITVEQTGEGEKVTGVMSPAPNEGQDPDRDAAVVEE